MAGLSGASGKSRAMTGASSGAAVAGAWAGVPEREERAGTGAGSTFFAAAVFAARAVLVRPFLFFFAIGTGAFISSFFLRIASLQRSAPRRDDANGGESCRGRGRCGQHPWTRPFKA